MRPGCADVRPQNGRFPWLESPLADGSEFQRRTPVRVHVKCPAQCLLKVLLRNSFPVQLHCRRSVNSEEQEALKSLTSQPNSEPNDGTDLLG